MEKVIRIACQGVASAPISEFHEMQGELKTLLKADFQKLRKEILKEGFSFALHVWEDPEKKKYLLDGHQRTRTVKKLIEDEGYTCPDIPYSLVFADDYKQAKQKLLGAASQYGRVQNDGLLEFIQDMEFKPEELAESYRFADLDINKFIASNFDQEEAEKKQVSFEAKTNGKEISEDEFTFSQKCPRCQFEFNP